MDAASSTGAPETAGDTENAEMGSSGLPADIDPSVLEEMGIDIEALEESSGGQAAPEEEPEP